MIQIFYSTYFYYRGKSSKYYNLKVITIDNTYTVQSVTKEISSEINATGKVISFNPIIKKMQEKEIIVAYVDEDDNPIQLTTDKLMEINDWLLSSDKYEEIMFDEYDSNGFVYYVQITGFERWDNFNKQGYFKMKVSFFDDYIHTRTEKRTISNYSDITSSIIEIENLSNVRLEENYPMIEVQNIKDGTNVTINNKSTGQICTIKNIPYGSKIQLYGDLQLPYINKSTYQWISTNFNYEWLKLKNGLNRISITGKCTVNFYVSFPFMI